MVSAEESSRAQRLLASLKASGKAGEELVGLSRRWQESGWNCSFEGACGLVQPPGGGHLAFPRILGNLPQKGGLLDVGEGSTLDGGALTSPTHPRGGSSVWSL